MRPVIFSFPTITQIEICATNTTGASGATLVLNGGSSNYPNRNSAGYVAFATPGGGIQRPVMVYSTGDISTSTFSVSGLDVNGYAVSTTFAGPSGTAVSTGKSTSEFAVVTAVSIGNTAATSPFTVGFGPSGTTNAAIIDGYPDPGNVSYSIVKVPTSGPVTFQNTFDNVFTATAPTWLTVTFSSGVAFASQTTATSITVAQNPFAARALLLATAQATGVVQVNIIQSGV